MIVSFKPEVKAEIDRKVFKTNRQTLVDNIKVEVDGMVFDGDERSQERMARSLIGLNEGETILWVLADNSPVTVTKDQLREALRLAGKQQTEAWIAV